MPKLGVNIDHIATLRQARRGAHPDPVEAACLAEEAGADGIVCHLREDRRHIQDADVIALRARVRTRLNLEMSIAPRVVQRALEVIPHQATLVPERRAELTTEGGLDVVQYGARVGQAVRALAAQGIVVSLFVDPDQAQLARARAVGAPMVELHTGRFASAIDAAHAARELAALRAAAMYAHGIGLRVSAGHGLAYHNTAPIAQLPHIEELNIGFSIVARAVMVGWRQAIQEMAALAHGVGLTDGAWLRR